MNYTATLPFTPKQEIFEIYTPQQISSLNLNHIPKHIAIIPDGNRRWAKKRFFLPELGHNAGAEIVTNVVNACRVLGVNALTIYTFSTENWQRPKAEVAMLMVLLKKYLTSQRESMIQKGIRLNTIGDLSPFSSDIKQIIQDTKDATAAGNKIDLILALNYGGRDEIRRAVHSIIDDYGNNKIRKEEITEAMIGKHLDTANWKDPDLLIRTSGEQRISNFLLWQLSYTEIFTTSVLWPEFTPHHLLEAILSYQKRERRLGGA